MNKERRNEEFHCAVPGYGPNEVLSFHTQNGLIAKTQVATAYRHISRRILDDFPGVFNQVSQHLLRQRDQFRLSDPDSLRQ